MQQNSPIFDRMTAAFARIAHRFTAYELVLPGTPAFICLADTCPTHCCKIYSVSLGEREAVRMERASGLARFQFLECEDGEPIALPLAQPYLLSRSEGQCSLLGANLYCGQYEGRPDACRLYPHFVIFLDEATDRPVHSYVEGMEASLERALAGEDPAPFVPLLLRHLECPGFTGPAVGLEAWQELLRETWQLQYGNEFAPAEGGATGRASSP
ncbi:MAG: YkgJ family cysteine cluster protein [Dehalococcoidia bacterium]|nr:YkgJ family cysteine cluster protein [Dehalococcoidia bacterium]